MQNRFLWMLHKCALKLYLSIAQEVRALQPLQNRIDLVKVCRYINLLLLNTRRALRINYLQNSFIQRSLVI